MGTAKPHRSNITFCDWSGGRANYVLGCTSVSEGCANCYARRLYERWGKGDEFAKVTPSVEKLDALAQWQPVEGDMPYVRGEGSRPICFVVDMGDLFHEKVSLSFAVYALATLAYRQDIDWLVFTKRPERMKAAVECYIGIDDLKAGELFPDNVWFVVSAENQRRLDERVPVLLNTPVSVRGVSIEPMLGPIDARAYLTCGWCEGTHEVDSGGFDPQGAPISVACPDHRALDWVIVGAESGPKRRAFDSAWAVSVWEQCQEAGVPFFGKQGSGLHPATPLLIEGREIHEWPR